ncbi:glutathione S-transferase N-terminal domain-containing protein [uncultured Sulfitobacter sp.]|uniref:glutathione S-transferase N-terminal domain-containing protein n=1 Tax=uncultured Sulfitobacter sp. TaxID=191468 RepID=UPI00260A33A5|nr:glutathione S-transferase N-terminal domain-containing protein [uncultured Sulfitobacter sp.]
MIKLHTWNTPNGQKPAILLEELGLEYDVLPINIGAGVQHNADFRALSPNGKIPALQDDGITLFESGAIILHLAEKHGAFLPADGQARADALAWTFWQVGGLGPMIGQWGHFQMAPEKLPYAIERYLAETLRLFDVLEKRLAEQPYLAGGMYSVADIMTFPWAKGGLQFLDGAVADRLTPLAHTRRWIQQIDTRPAVVRALARLDRTVQKG